MDRYLAIIATSYSAAVAFKGVYPEMSINALHGLRLKIFGSPCLWIGSPLSIICSQFLFSVLETFQPIEFKIIDSENLIRRAILSAGSLKVIVECIRTLF